MFSELTTGVYATGEGSVLFLPTNWKADGTRRGVIYSHGATNTHTQLFGGGTFAGIYDAARLIADAGHPVFAGYFGGDAWGNSTAVARFTDAFLYLTGTVGAKTDKVGLMGGSMGGCVLAWAAQNLSKVTSFAGWVPVSDISDIHTNNRGLLRSSINTAYGGSWTEATYGATYNPSTLATNGNLAGLRYKAWYGSSDTVVISTTVTGVATAIGATASTVAVAGDHSSTINLVTASDVSDFMRTYLA